MFSSTTCFIFPDNPFLLLQERIPGYMIGKGNLQNNLYVLDTPALSSPFLFASHFASLESFRILSQHHSQEHIISQISSDVWHQRLGHPSHNKIHVLSMLLKLSSLKNNHSDLCKIYPLAKQKRISFPSNPHLSKAPFDLIHIDVWGPFQTPTHDGYKYFFTLVDDCTRVTWIYLLKDKSSVASVFPEFVQFIKTQYNSNIKAIRSDNAPELAFTSLMRTHGIVYFFSCPYSPQQNSVVERKNQHILNVSRALMFQSGIPLQYWGECVQTAVYLINRTPSPSLQDKSPFELLTKNIPTYDHLRVFGCLCFASTLLKDHNKFSPRASPCVFLGYPNGFKGYIIFQLDTNTISVSRNVVFHESVFPFLKDSHTDVYNNFFDQDVLPLLVPDSPFPAFFDLGNDNSDPSLFVDPSYEQFVPNSSTDITST